MVSSRSAGTHRNNQTNMSQKTNNTSTKGASPWKDEEDEKTLHICSENNSSCSTNNRQDQLKSASSPYYMAQEPDEDEDEDEEYDDDEDYDDDDDDDDDFDDEDEDYDDDEDEDEEEEGSHSKGAASHHSNSKKPVRKN